MSTANFVDPNNCALDAHGNLKDACDIQFYDSEGDVNPISSTKGNAEAGPSSKSALSSCILVMTDLACLSFKFSNNRMSQCPAKGVYSCTCTFV